MYVDEIEVEFQSIYMIKSRTLMQLTPITVYYFSSD